MLKLAALFALASVAFAQLQIQSPAAMFTCQPVLLSWAGGSAPYFLNVLPGGQVSGTPIKQFGQQTGTSLTWNVDVAAGTSITLAITDSSGQTAYSSPITIQAGSSTTCVNGNTSVTGVPGSSAAPASTTGPAASSSSAAAASSSSTASVAASSSRASLASSLSVAASSAAAPPASTSPSSGANKAVAGFGTLALAGVAIAIMA